MLTIAKPYVDRLKSVYFKSIVYDSWQGYRGMIDAVDCYSICALSVFFVIVSTFTVELSRYTVQFTVSQIQI